MIDDLPSGREVGAPRRRTSQGRSAARERAAAAEWLAPATLGRGARAARRARPTPPSSPAARSSASSSTRASPSPPRCSRSPGWPSCAALEVAHGGELRIGAMVTHRTLERDPRVREGWPALARAFSLVASPRVRNQATVGGVLADADYASDPPAMLAALEARVVLRSPRGAREVAVADLILGYYETCIEPDELLVEVRVPPAPDAAVYRKFRSRSSEDRPCVAVAAARRDGAPPRRRRRGRRHAAALPRRVRARRRARGRDRRARTPSGSRRSTTPAARPPTAAASPPSRSAARSRRWR